LGRKLEEFAAERARAATFGLLRRFAPPSDDEE
jgi:hypothetical protein